MGLLLVTGMLCAVFIGMPAFASYRVLATRFTEPHRRNLLQVGIFSLSVAAAALLFPTVMNGVLQSTAVVERNATPAEYCGMGPSLPAEATQIHYHSNYMGCEATFTITETALLRWIKSEMWKEEAITSPQRVELPRLGIAKSIDEGLVVSERFADRGTGVYLTFDAKTSTCYYRYSSW